MMINLNFDFSNYQTLIKAHKNTPYKRNKNFQCFKKKWNEKKKAIIIVSRTTLCTQKIKFCMQKFFFGKCLFAYKIRFAVEIVW